MTFYRFIQGVVRTLFPLAGTVEVTGLENIPREGPFFLVANHQSYLDPMLIQTVVPREVYTMAKSTQFSDPLTGRMLRRLKSFPVRRFETDPQAVRIALRRLHEGYGVGIYIEGERSWDGRLQPPRLGALRLILKGGAPVVPCGIAGTYHVWPRWDHAFRRGRVRIAFGPPLDFGRVERREDREAALPAVGERIMDTLTHLSGAPRADGRQRPAGADHFPHS
ncbi:MAG TPA: lysophospholipid acyltransferase family protein [Longimicrobiales bacterium]|nr:lysophospholipid acyltransferase family protein [Longimicrobiales bacterium]